MITQLFTPFRALIPLRKNVKTHKSRRIHKDIQDHKYPQEKPKWSQFLWMPNVKSTEIIYKKKDSLDFMAPRNNKFCICWFI